MVSNQRTEKTRKPIPLLQGWMQRRCGARCWLRCAAAARACGEEGGRGVTEGYGRVASRLQLHARNCGRSDPKLPLRPLSTPFRLYARAPLQHRRTDHGVLQPPHRCAPHHPRAGCCRRGCASVAQASWALLAAALLPRGSKLCSLAARRRPPRPAGRGSATCVLPLLPGCY